jgi:hypothetical protein
MSGHMLGDKAMKISRTQIKMTGDEILAWMDEKLRVEDAAQECISLHERGPPKSHYFMHDTSHFPSSVAPALVLATTQLESKPTANASDKAKSPPNIPSAPPKGGGHPKTSDLNAEKNATSSVQFSDQKQHVTPNRGRTPDRGNSRAGHDGPISGQNLQWRTGPTLQTPASPNYPHAMGNVQWQADPYAMQNQPWQPPQGKVTGKGNNQRMPPWQAGKGNTSDQGGGRGNMGWNGKGDNSWNQYGDRPYRSRSRSKDSNVVTNPDPNPGTWSNGYAAGSCWACYGEGKEFNHDYRKCQEDRRQARNRAPTSEPRA